MSAPALSNEFIALLRAAAAEARADVVQAAPGIAELLRMIAEQIDRARSDLDVLASAGILVEVLGEILRDEALRS